MHQTVSVDQLHPKELPKTVRSYNTSKVNVDVLDKMAIIPAKVPQEGGQWLYFLILLTVHASMHI